MSSSVARVNAAANQPEYASPRRTAPARAGLAVVALLLAGLVATPTARAHDLYEVWTNAVVRTDELEVLVTMASLTALRLIDPEMNSRPLTPETFAARVGALKRAGATLFVVTSMQKPLAVQDVAVELTEEYDVVFRIRLPRPAPGPLRFHGAFIKKLGEGYGGILDVGEATGNHLGWEQLSTKSTDLEVVVPTPAPAPRN